MTRRIAIALSTIAVCLPNIAGAADDLSLQNEQLRVTWDSANNEFQLADAAGRTFAQLRFTAEGTPRVADWRHPQLGEGRAIEIPLPDDGTGRVIVLPELPFVLVQQQLHNATQTDRAVKHLRAFDLTLDLPEPAAELKALGTAGLTAPNEHPGSYAFLAVASPKTRRGVVTGWLSHDRGSGVVFSSIHDERVRVQPQIDYGRLPVRAGATVASEIFAVGHFDDARLGLESYADAIARYYSIKLRPLPTGYCTWYSSPHGGAGDEVHIAELAAAAAEKLKPWGFQFVQIDDKWQLGQRRNGPAKVFTTHHPKGPYPNGMKKPAEQIESLGLMPGIWFMPFAGDRADPFFADRQHWFVQRADGTPYWARWGGTSLDMTHPETQAYVRDVVSRIAHHWGYRYFKMDGLWVGTATKLTYVNNGYVEDDIGEAVFHDPQQTNIEAYRNGFRLVREAAGPDVFFLGCCASQNMRSFGGSFGLVDAMRIGPDNGASWDALRRGPWHGTNRYFLHGRVWYNDPDPIYVRPSTPLEHARAICSWVTLSGGLNAFSEWLPSLPAERVELLRRTMPNHGLRPRPVDLFETDLARIWLLTDTRGEVRRDIVGLFNWDEHKPLQIDRPLAEIGLPDAAQYVGFDYWANRFVPPFSDRLQCTLPGGTCRVLTVRPAAPHPQLIGTSRHITQGVVDVLAERFDADQPALVGRSRLVAGDPYELRILVPTGESSFVVSGVTASTDQPGGKILTSWTQDGPTVRVQLDPSVGGEVDWSVQFHHAPVEVAAPRPVGQLVADVAYHQIALRWQSDAGNAFRVTRSDGRTFDTAEQRLLDTQFEHGTEYRYTVQAVGWDGRLSPPTFFDVTTPKQLVLPPVPPKPDVSIATLEPLVAHTGWGRIHENRSCEDNPLKLLGTTYTDGVGMHAPGLLVFAVPQGAVRFVATAGIDDEERTDPRSSVVVRLLADADEMGERPTPLASSPVLSDETVRLWHFDVPLTTRTRKLHLVVGDADDGNACDHLDWVNAGFILEK